MRVYGSSSRGWLDVPTYRGRPPQRDELEKVRAFNMTDTGSERALTYTDSHVTVDDDRVLARVAFVPASGQFNGDRWALLVLGTGYTASVSLEGLTPDHVVLTMTDHDDGYTDLRTALQHHADRG